MILDNKWSIVTTPSGVSLRHVKDGLISYNGEVCLRVKDGLMFISVHIDGLDLPITTITMPTEALKPQ